MSILLYDLVGRDPARPYSPHCWKAAMALSHKGLAFESVPTTFLQVPDIEGGLSKSVPVIRDGDNVVSDSFAIAFYLLEIGGQQTLIPQGLEQLSVPTFLA
jgi:glutathione S-transferase